MRSGVVTFIASALVLLTSGGSLARAATAPNAHVLVSFAPAATASQRETAVRAIRGVVDGEIPAIGVTRIALPADSQAAAEAIAQEPGVVAAEADGVARIELVPNDPFYLTDPFTGLGQWGLRAARVDRAWDLVRGSPNVIVANVDTGVDANHPDLAGALLAPAATLLNAGASGCAISPVDDNSHGTHVAGIIGALANNGTGVAGVAWGVKVLSIKALDCTGAGAVSDVASGIIYAADHGARIVNISLGTPDDSFTLRSAVKYAQDKGLLVIAAAGNCGLGGTRCDQVNQIEYPAAYPGVLAVAATASDDTRAAFSTQASYVGVAAPGAKIISTTPTYPTYQSGRGVTMNYGVFSGTSQASPFVAAIAALILSSNPALTAAQVTDRIKATADDLGAPGPDTSFGAGRVNALRAISAPGGTYGAVYDTAKVPVTASSGAGLPVTVKITNTSNFTWTANSAVRLAYHWIDQTGTTAVWEGVRTPLPADLAVNGSMDLPALVVPPLIPGRYVLRFDMVREGVTWFSGTGVPTGDLVVGVSNGLAASYASGVLPTLLPGGRAPLAVTLRNDGTVTWSAVGVLPVHAAAHVFDVKGAAVRWDGPRTVLSSDVPRGTSIAASLSVDAPLTPGVYRAQPDLVQEGVAWFSAYGSRGGDVPFVVVPDYAAALPSGPVTVSRSNPIATITAANTSSALWSADGPAPVTFSAHWLDAAGRVLLWDGPRTPLARNVAAGTSITAAVALGAPPAGATQLVIDLVAEGVRWFGVGAQRPVTLTP